MAVRIKLASIVPDDDHACGLEPLIGSRLEESAVREAVAASVAGIETMRDHHASAAYRARVASALVRRAILDARDAAAGGLNAR